MMLHTKYQGSRPCGFRQKDFSTFSLYNVTPGQAIFSPRAIMSINLVKLYWVMLITKYQESRLSEFRQEDF